MSEMYDGHEPKIEYQPGCLECAYADTRMFSIRCPKTTSALYLFFHGVKIVPANGYCKHFIYAKNKQHKKQIQMSEYGYVCK